jgi:hypothetical protein
MRSSTSSSNASEFDRPLPGRPMGASWLVAVLVCVLMIGAWEMYWRGQGATPAYRNSEGLWAIQRRRIDAGDGHRQVLTGSSRTLFNLNLDTWEKVSGERPIQLALEGTSPLGVLESLAEDPHFTGQALVGVAPGLFYSGFEYRKKALTQFDKESWSQWLGQQISMRIEPFFAFYEPDFALFTVLERQPLPDREGVQNELDVRKLSNTISVDRNTQMWSRVETDPAYADIAQRTWADGFKPIEERDAEWIEKSLETRKTQIDRAVAAVETLRARGVEVIFVQHPVEGHYAVAEPMYHPRDKTWDVLIERSGAIGLHWQDHPEMQGYRLPEWSHMSASEAQRYTETLLRLIEQERARNKEQE